MKKTALLTVCIIPILSFAQLRHVKGLNGVGVDAGISRYGLVLGANYEKFLSNKLYFQGNMFFETVTLTSQRIGVQCLGIEPGINYTFFKTGDLYCNAFGGCSVIIYEKATGNAEAVFSEINKFRIGAFIGPELEYYISSQLTLIGNFTEKIYFYNNNYGRQRWSLTIGARYNF